MVRRGRQEKEWVREGGQRKMMDESWLSLKRYRKWGQRWVVTCVQSAGRARTQPPGIKWEAQPSSPIMGERVSALKRGRNPAVLSSASEGRRF